MKFSLFLIPVFIILNVQFLVGQNQAEIRPEGIVLPRTASDTSILGMIRYDTSSNEFNGYNGKKWVRLNSEPQERQIVISACSLIPSSNYHTHYHTVGYSYMDSLNNQPSFFTSFNLPDSAILLRLSAIIYDKSATQHLAVCLYKDETINHAFLTNRVATVESEFSFYDYERYIDYDISDETAGSGESYIVRVHAVNDSDGFLSDWPHNKLRIAKITVVYTMP